MNPAPVSLCPRDASSRNLIVNRSSVILHYARERERERETGRWRTWTFGKTETETFLWNPIGTFGDLDVWGTGTFGDLDVWGTGTFVGPGRF